MTADPATESAAVFGPRPVPHPGGNVESACYGDGDPKGLVCAQDPLGKEPLDELHRCGAHEVRDTRCECCMMVLQHPVAVARESRHGGDHVVGNRLHGPICVWALAQRSLFFSWIGGCRRARQKGWLALALVATASRRPAARRGPVGPRRVGAEAFTTTTMKREKEGAEKTKREKEVAVAPASPSAKARAPKVGRRRRPSGTT